MKLLLKGGNEERKFSYGRWFPPPPPHNASKHCSLEFEEQILESISFTSEPHSLGLDPTKQRSCYHLSELFFSQKSTSKNPLPSVLSCQSPPSPILRSSPSKAP